MALNNVYATSRYNVYNMYIVDELIRRTKYKILHPHKDLPKTLEKTPLSIL